MARKNNKGKPTRKEIEQAIAQIYQTLNYMGQKLEYLENFAKSTDLALDLYTKFKKDHDKFTKYIEKFNKEQQKKQEKELAKKEEPS
tara:strand:+ start:288 stop:548 length:261 start_codon:yes stop_codon:yes gene_type:complete